MNGAGNGGYGAAGNGGHDGRGGFGAAGQEGDAGAMGAGADGAAGAEGAATAAGGSSAPPGRQGLPGRGDGEYGPPPADIPSGEDDDIVARQIREAALNEPDPELREKLWDEYRRYKGLK